jgi:hypothetical protein
MDPLALLLIPVMYFLLIRPIVWVLYRWLPSSRAKTFLFRTRGPVADWSRGHTLYRRYSWRWWVSW